MKTKISNFLVVAIIASCAIKLAEVLDLHAWILFLGWVSYFIFVKNIKDAGLTFFQIAVGVVLAKTVVLGSIFLSDYIPEYALMVSVFLIAGSLTLAESAEPLNNIPAYYIGMITFFAAGLPLGLSSFIEIITPLVVGLCLGWLTIFSRIKIQYFQEARNV